MKITTGDSVHPDVGAAAEEAWLHICLAFQAEPNFEPKLLICHANADYDAALLQQALLKLIPETCQLAGSSSCLGAMNEAGFHVADGAGLSLMVFAEDEGDFGVGLVRQDGASEQAAVEALVQAIADAGRPGELPSLIWMNASPGQEEALLQGIASVVGSHVPVVGGSSADNEIKGEWWQFSKQTCTQNGVLLIAFYPDCAIDLSFHSGYAPTPHVGIVTKAEGRIVYTIDHQPAAEVYNQWTQGSISSKLAGGNILQDSTFSPLGVEAGTVEGAPYFAMKHPEQVLDDGAMRLFSNVERGEKLTLMEGSRDSLTRRAGTVIGGLMARKGWAQEQVAGALIVYCAGCMLGVREHMLDVHQGIRSVLGDTPFQAVFTFGEQGCFIDGVNRHGNLLISAILFVNEEA
ncbi:MAG: FIST N-terminal domain-containing protein [Ghiorsea sp.]|nr:FIST N-terminal domain-containing protein [Ghiorsea sp.]